MTKPQAEAKESSVVTLKDVIFVYSSVSYPAEQLNTDKKPPLSDDPLEFHSYEIKVLMIESRYKKLKKAYTGAKNLVNAKDYTVEEAEESFGIEIQERLGLEADDDLVQVKFSQTCLVGKAGNRRPSIPITQIGIKGKVQDHQGNSIDYDTRLGNGTEGHFQFRPVVGTNGLYLYPHLLCITSLVEFAGAVEEDLESLGLEELSDEELDAMEEEAGDPEPEAGAEDKSEASDEAGEPEEDDDLF